MGSHHLESWEHAAAQSHKREQDPVAQEFLSLSIHACGFTPLHFI